MKSARFSTLSFSVVTVNLLMWIDVISFTLRSCCAVELGEDGNETVVFDALLFLQVKT